MRTETNIDIVSKQNKERRKLDELIDKLDELETRIEELEKSKGKGKSKGKRVKKLAEEVDDKIIPPWEKEGVTKQKWLKKYK